MTASRTRLGSRSISHALVRANAAVVLLASAAGAQQPPPPPRAADSAARAVPGPPVRRIATATAVSTEPLGSITSVRELPDGRLMLNDGQRRRLILMDTTLRVVGVVLDSLSDVENSYGTRAGALVPYRGDSTLFVDPASFAMLVLDGSGRIARVRSVPRTQDVQWLTSQGGNNGWPGTDARGRIVHRLNARQQEPRGGSRGPTIMQMEPDSAFIVAIDPDSRKLDTLGTVRLPRSAFTMRRGGRDGGFSFNQITNPLPTTDEWAVLSDGSVAFVRAIDYRVEYLQADGTLTSSGKLPFDWQRITPDDKQRMVDSVKAIQMRGAQTQYLQQLIRWANTYEQPFPAGLAVPQGFNVQFGLPRGWRLPAGMSFPARYIHACGPGEEPTMTPNPAATGAAGAAGAAAATSPARGAPPGGGPPGGGPPGGNQPGGAAQGAQGTPSCIPGPSMPREGRTPPPPVLREVSVIDPNELPDYRPPIAPGAVRADADGNLWIRTNPARPVPGGPVYDVVSRGGELIDRLQLPPGYTLVGFGRGRVVYLSMRDQGGIRLARVRLR